MRALLGLLKMGATPLPSGHVDLRPRPAGDVAKWSKALVCKTNIRRFESARRLHLFLACLVACSDPPDPPPATDGPSTAKWVEWRSDAAPVARPIAIFVDAPGGSADSVAADAAVTTFLNDRFHPLFRLSDPAQAAGTVQFLTADGCAFGAPFTPGGPSAFIEAANIVMLRAESTGRRAPQFTRSCPHPLDPSR